jgi:DNA anti-recombination protein RmuC
MKKVAALLAVTLALVACSSSSSSPASTAPTSTSSTPLSVADYVAGVCTAFSSFRTSVQQRNASFDPTTTDLTTLKQGWLDFLDGMTQDTQELLSRIEALGTPDTSDAQAAADTFKADFEKLKTDLQTLRDQSASLSTDDQASFMSSFQQLVQTLQQDFQGVGRDLSQLSTGFQSAASAAPECEALNSASPSPSA